MKQMRAAWILFVYWVLILSLVPAFAAGSVDVDSESEKSCKEEKKVNPMARADQLLEQSDLDALKLAIAIYKKISKSEPGNFEALWKCAKAHREYGEAYKKKGYSQWKKVCTQYGNNGMTYAQKAIRMSPDKPHGYLFYGLNVGIYSDGVGILTALKEGLKDKTQSNFEKAYRMDKSLEKGAPIIALGRFWQVVPWPFNDKDKAEALYREFQETEYWDDNVEARIYLAELLADKWGSSPKKEARRYLQEVKTITDDPYWRNKAQAMLNEL